MWMMNTGTRVLTEPEWALYRIGLAPLSSLIEDEAQQRYWLEEDPECCDLYGDVDPVRTYIPVFDGLSANHRLTLLAETARALRDPTIAAPTLTAVNEGAIAAVFSRIEEELDQELDDARGKRVKPVPTHIRQLLRAVGEEDDERGTPLPSKHATRGRRWKDLLQEFKDRIFWDDDYLLVDLHQLLPRRARKRWSRGLMIAPDYFVLPKEPSGTRQARAQTTLWRLLDWPGVEEMSRSPVAKKRTTKRKRGQDLD